MYFVQRVRLLRLVGAAQLHEHQAHRRLGEVAVLREFGRQDHPGGKPHLGQLLLAHLADRVARGHVPDFVAEDGCQFRLRVHVGHDAARHVDEAAGDRKRVHRRVVDDAERPGQIGPLGVGGNPGTQILDVALQRLVRIQADRRDDVLVRLAAHLDLLRLADQGQLALAGDRVGGAGDRPEAAQGDAAQPEGP